jgi:hypothetical protein
MTWVREEIYAAGGAHIPATWGDFADQTGVTAVVHLSPGRPAAFRGAPPRAFLWLGISEEAQAGLAERWLAAGFIACCLAEGRRVLLHSSLGRHRTRWAFVAHSIHAGLSARAALRVAAERPWLAPYHTDVAAWEAFEAYVRARREEGHSMERDWGCP